MNFEVLSDLIKKRDELERRVASFERKILSLSKDLSDMRSALAFHRQDVLNANFLPHMDFSRLFNRRELQSICITALKQAEEGMNSRELAEEVIRIKGLDEEDPVLCEKMTLKVAYVMRKAFERQLVIRGDRRGGLDVWWIRGVS